MRRRPRRQDTVDARATSELALHQLGQYLHQIIDELSEREIGVMRLRYGLGDEAFLRTWDEIAQIYGVTRERVRQIELKTIQKLANRHGDSDFIRDLLDAADYSGLPAHVEERALGRPRGPRWTDRLETVFCRRHQAHHVLDFGERQCPWCSCIASRNSNGRRRTYCSNACRQAAHRARKNNEQARDL